jgi:hypothetical protein
MLPLLLLASHLPLPPLLSLILQLLSFITPLPLPLLLAVFLPLLLVVLLPLLLLLLFLLLPLLLQPRHVLRPYPYQQLLQGDRLMPPQPYQLLYSLPQAAAVVATAQQLLRHYMAQYRPKEAHYTGVRHYSCC